jgi:hypothetical protein
MTCAGDGAWLIGGRRVWWCGCQHARERCTAPEQVEMLDGFASRGARPIGSRVLYATGVLEPPVKSSCEETRELRFQSTSGGEENVPGSRTVLVGKVQVTCDTPPLLHSRFGSATCLPACTPQYMISSLRFCSVPGSSSSFTWIGMLIMPGDANTATTTESLEENCLADAAALSTFNARALHCYENVMARANEVRRLLNSASDFLPTSPPLARKPSSKQR